MRLLAIDIDDLELWAKVAKDLAEDTTRLRHNELDAVGVTVAAELDLLLSGALSKHDHLVGREIGGRERFAVEQLDGHVRVELGEVRVCGGGAVRSDVRVCQVELVAQIVEARGARVVDAYWFHASENDVFRDFYA